MQDVISAFRDRARRCAETRHLAEEEFVLTHATRQYSARHSHVTLMDLGVQPGDIVRVRLHDELVGGGKDGHKAAKGKPKGKGKDGKGKGKAPSWGKGPYTSQPPWIANSYGGDYDYDHEWEDDSWQQGRGRQAWRDSASQRSGSAVSRADMDDWNPEAFSEASANLEDVMTQKNCRGALQSCKTVLTQEKKWSALFGLKGEKMWRKLHQVLGDVRKPGWFESVLKKQGRTEVKSEGPVPPAAPPPKRVVQAVSPFAPSVPPLKSNTNPGKVITPPKPKGEEVGTYYAHVRKQIGNIRKNWGKAVGELMYLEDYRIVIPQVEGKPDTPPMSCTQTIVMGINDDGPELVCASEAEMKVYYEMGSNLKRTHPLVFLLHSEPKTEKLKSLVEKQNLVFEDKESKSRHSLTAWSLVLCCPGAVFRHGGAEELCQGKDNVALHGVELIVIARWMKDTFDELSEMLERNSAEEIIEWFTKAVGVEFEESEKPRIRQVGRDLGMAMTMMVRVNEEIANRIVAGSGAGSYFANPTPKNKFPAMALASGRTLEQLQHCMQKVHGQSMGIGVYWHGLSIRHCQENKDNFISVVPPSMLTENLKVPMAKFIIKGLPKAWAKTAAQQAYDEFAKRSQVDTPIDTLCKNGARRDDVL